MKNELSSPQTSGDSTLLPRRQFLVLGSVAVAAAATSTLSADLVRGSSAGEHQSPRISLGYVPATVEDFASPSFAARLAPATKLRSGDSSLTGGVRLKVHGLVRPEAQRDTDVSVGIDAMYRVPGHMEDVPFMAWSYARTRQHTSSSAQNGFVVPVSATEPLSLAISTSAVKTAVGNAALRAKVTLALGEGRRTNKLRTGLYFVAICPAGMEAPHWASIHATAPADGTAPRLVQTSLTGYEPVPFDYVVVAAQRA
jgi:hypothetical protein